MRHETSIILTSGCCPIDDPTEHPYRTVVFLCVVPFSTEALQRLTEGIEVARSIVVSQGAVGAAVGPVERC